MYPCWRSIGKRSVDFHQLKSRKDRYSFSKKKNTSGVLNGDRVVCPWHGACFNVRTGDIEVKSHSLVQLQKSHPIQTDLFRWSAISCVKEIFVQEGMVLQKLKSYRVAVREGKVWLQIKKKSKNNYFSNPGSFSLQVYVSDQQPRLAIIGGGAAAAAVILEIWVMLKTEINFVLW